MAFFTSNRPSTLVTTNSADLLAKEQPITSNDAEAPPENLWRLPLISPADYARTDLNWIGEQAYLPYPGSPPEPPADSRPITPDHTPVVVCRAMDNPSALLNPNVPFNPNDPTTFPEGWLRSPLITKELNQSENTLWINRLPFVKANATPPIPLPQDAGQPPLMSFASSQDIAQTPLVGIASPPALPQNIVSADNDEVSGKAVTAINNELYYFDETKGKYRRLCNYCPIVVKRYRHIRRHSRSVEIIECIICFEKTTFEESTSDRSIMIPLSAIDTVHQQIKDVFSHAYLVCSTALANRSIDAFLSEQLGQIPLIPVYRNSGWQKISGRMRYLHDNVVLGKGFCDTGKKIVPLDLSPRQALEEALNFLSISENLEKTIIPFLFAHLGLMTRIFEDAGYPIRFLLFMNGTSGSLKTAICKVLFYFFNNKPNQLSASFKDTVAALELKMNEATDTVLLLDDFHPAISKANQNEMGKVLETMIRFYGDGIGKARGTSEMNVVKETSPQGVCAITGEDVRGSSSSLLRCVFLEVEPQSYNGNLLSHYQKNPDLLPTHYHFFIMFLEKHYAHIVAQIQDIFETYRGCLGVKRRLEDAGATLCIMCDVLGMYYQEVTGNILADVSQWKMAIQEAIMASEQNVKDKNPAKLYLEALCALYTVHEIHIAANLQEYIKDVGRFIGYKQHDIWWLNPGQTHQKVIQYWSRQGLYWSLSQEKIHAALSQAYCIALPKQSGDTPNRYLCRTSFGHRPYYLKLYYPRMLEILGMGGNDKA